MKIDKDDLYIYGLISGLIICSPFLGVYYGAKWIYSHTPQKVKEKKQKIKIKNMEDIKMKEFKYVVTDNEGIHARPAGELVKLVKGFESTISIEKEGKKVDCRKLLALMGLGVKKGHEVTFTIEGADEEAAYEAVSKFMQENL